MVAHHLGWTVNEVQVIVDTDVRGNTERWAPDGLAEANEFFDSMVIDLAALAAGCEFSGLFDDVQNLWDNARRLEVLQRELRDAPEQAEQRDPDHLTDRPVAELVTEAFHRARLTLEGRDDEVEAVQSRLLAEGKLPPRRRPVPARRPRTGVLTPPCRGIASFPTRPRCGFPVAWPGRPSCRPGARRPASTQEFLVNRTAERTTGALADQCLACLRPCSGLMLTCQR